MKRRDVWSNIISLLSCLSLSHSLDKHFQQTKKFANILFSKKRSFSMKESHASIRGTVQLKSRESHERLSNWTFFFLLIYLLKEKENRKAEVPLNAQHVSSNAPATGSLPKRYQSVFTEGTPLTSFGVRNDDNHTRAHSVGLLLKEVWRNSSNSIFSLPIICSHNLINDHLNLWKNFFPLLINMGKEKDSSLFVDFSFFSIETIVDVHHRRSVLSPRQRDFSTKSFDWFSFSRLLDKWLHAFANRSNGAKCKCCLDTNVE